MPVRREPGHSPAPTEQQLTDARRDALSVQCPVMWTTPLGRHRCVLVNGHRGSHARGGES